MLCILYQNTDEPRRNENGINMCRNEFLTMSGSSIDCCAFVSKYLRKTLGWRKPPPLCRPRVKVADDLADGVQLKAWKTVAWLSKGMTALAQGPPSCMTSVMRLSRHWPVLGVPPIWSTVKIMAKITTFLLVLQIQCNYAERKIFH